MNGLEISRAYFEQHGMPMLKEQFPDLLPQLAAGLAGSGSECFGYDDELSRDHDFEPGFCLFLPGEDRVSRQQEFLLERAYAKLPRRFMGISRPLMQPAGGARRGVVRISGFFREKTGSENGDLTPLEWLNVPQSALAEAVNGEIFYDGPGIITGIRDRLAGYPEDIRRKKLAGHMLLMAQSGRYNYPRCVERGETGAAQLAVFEFARHSMAAIFLLNRRYRPYYKWCFRALRALPRLSLNAELLEYLITTGSDGDLFRDKREAMDSVAADVIEEAQHQQLTRAECGDLEKHAYSVADGIRDARIRNLHILAGAEDSV